MQPGKSRQKLGSLAAYREEAKHKGGTQRWSTKGSNWGKRAPNVRDHTGVPNDTLACETAAIGGALSATMQMREENKGFPKSDPGPNP